jgi:hypothetical protein
MRWWRKTSESMPGKDVDVLVAWSNGDMMIARWTGCAWADGPHAEDELANGPDYWMPLPRAPEVKA